LISGALSSSCHKKRGYLAGTSRPLGEQQAAPTAV